MREIGIDRLERGIPEVRRDGENAVSADLLRMARKLHRVFDRERADVDRHRDTLGHHLDGRFGEQLAFRDGEVERLSLVVRPGDGGCAGAYVEVQHPLEGRKIEAEIVLERRHRTLHDASEPSGHCAFQSVNGRVMDESIGWVAKLSHRTRGSTTYCECGPA